MKFTGTAYLHPISLEVVTSLITGNLFSYFINLLFQTYLTSLILFPNLYKNKAKKKFSKYYLN